jgi:hypothetical protein
MTTTIGPALGHGPWTQQGVGSTPGYDAIDVRRLLDGVVTEGVLTSTSFAVTQRGAGANMSVDIAASTGDGARIQGDAVTLQSFYRVAPHSAVINETIAAADATNPRNDLVVLEIKDTQHDASGSNLAQTRVVTGTPNASAAQTDALGVNGTPTLPASAIPLAVVNVPATDTAITTSQIDDRRTTLWRGGAGGVCSIATSEARTNTAYGTHTTPDVVKNIVVPANALVLVSYQALWASSIVDAGRAALFIGSNQLKVQQSGSPPAPTVQEASNSARGAAGDFVPLGSSQSGLKSGWVAGGISSSSDVTTGMVLGPGAGATGESFGGPIWVTKLAAGTYDFSIKTKSASGSVTLKERVLTVAVIGFG